MLSLFTVAGSHSPGRGRNAGIAVVGRCDPSERLGARDLLRSWLVDDVITFARSGAE